VIRLYIYSYFSIYSFIGIIDNCLRSENLNVEIEYDLEFENEQRDHILTIEDIEEIEDKNSEDSEDDNEELLETGSSPTEGEPSSQSSPFSSPTKRLKEYIPFDYKKRAVEFWKSGKKKYLSFTTVKNSFKKLKNRETLYIWEKQIENKGTRNDKLLLIYNSTVNRFIEAKNSRLIVHESDLRRWALNTNREVGLENFTASSKWIHNFKKANRIVSRKITKFVTRKYSEEMESISSRASSFVESAIPYIYNYGSDLVYNTDQSGFNLEIHSGRTLETQGSRHVEAVVQSVSATTHSYTIQPTISADGKLMSPLFIVLQETSGEFGPRVRENLFQAPNVYVTASRSGKLTKDHLKTWFKDVFFPNVGEKSILLIDSWTTYNDIDAINEVTPDGKDLELLTIPKQTTSLVQPLDVYGFRIWKDFVRKFSDRIIMDHLDVNLHLRNDIIKLQSLVHNQFSSPRFVNMFKYSWFKCGYLEERPPNFQNPTEFCFASNGTECHECSEFHFIICSWCKKSLCFTHFYADYHYCDNYIT
jgi:hypothetical protein